MTVGFLSDITPRRAAGFALLFSVGALGAAYIAQYGFGLQPCNLCLYQRVPYAVAIVIALAALALPLPASLRIWALTAMGVVFLAGAAIAFYHVGVEQHWWVSAVSCGSSIESGLSVEQLRERLLATPPQSCDQVTWSLFGLSMASYNVVYSLGLSAACFAVALRGGNRP
jgi:disulfide bond formation protein DsbB